jgi:GNAT superfamily N-acetyltransferase
VASEQFRVEPLAPGHDRTTFDCGVEALDRYVRQQAGQDVRNNLAAVFLLVDVDAGSIVGYYTLSATAIQATSLPPEVTKRLARYPVLPAVLLGRLAVDRRYQGRGFGGVLLVNGLRRAFAQREQIGAMAVIVDAKDDAARAFYERYGFQRLVDHEDRLFLPMAAIARSDQLSASAVSRQHGGLGAVAQPGQSTEHQHQMADS